MCVTRRRQVQREKGRERDNERDNERDAWPGREIKRDLCVSQRNSQSPVTFLLFDAPRRQDLGETRALFSISVTVFMRSAVRSSRRNARITGKPCGISSGATVYTVHVMVKVIFNANPERYGR